MEAQAKIRHDLLKEAVGLPRLGPKGNRNRLAEIIELQTATADGVHDGSVVHDPGLNPLLTCADEEIGVGGGSEWISHDLENRIRTS